MVGKVLNFTAHRETPLVQLERLVKVEIPVTTAKPTFYRRNDLKTMIDMVVNTQHPVITEPIDALYQDLIQTNYSSELSYKILYKNHPTHNTICNVQPSPRLAARVFPFLTYSREILHILKKIRCKKSDPIDSEYIQLC